MHYKKAPILEAVLEFRWSPAKPLEAIRGLLGIPAFTEFEEPRPRRRVRAALDVGGGSLSHESREIGFELAPKDGSEHVFLEDSQFVFIQHAPYDCWECFLPRALSFLEPTIDGLGIEELSRVGVRFVNRIDVPLAAAGNFNRDDYINIKFDGPRPDKGQIDEFQMRVVKPTVKEGISYALVVATTPSPLPSFGGIVLDIDVFTSRPTPASGPPLKSVLDQMRNEKNDIFESCITDKARKLFGGMEE